MIRLVYPTDPNFGDAMSPLIVEKLSGQKVVPSGMWNADMMAVGSVFFRGDYFMADTYRAGMMRRLKAAAWDFRRITSKPVRVWGSGFLQYPPFKHPHIMRKFKVLALRGLYTRKILEKFGLMHPDEKVAFGDPGLLFAKLFGIKANPKYDIGIVPHYYDNRHGWGKRIETAFLANGIKARLINLEKEPVAVVSEIAKCERIISSSLHGLIVADSLEIPNMRMELSWLSHSQTDYMLKFKDYYSAFGEDLPSSVDGDTLLRTPMDITRKAIFHRVGVSRVEEINHDLIASFSM